MRGLGIIVVNRRRVFEGGVLSVGGGGMLRGREW